MSPGVHCFVVTNINRSQVNVCPKRPAFQCGAVYHNMRQLPSSSQINLSVRSQVYIMVCLAYQLETDTCTAPMPAADASPDHIGTGAHIATPSNVCKAAHTDPLTTGQSSHMNVWTSCSRCLGTRAQQPNCRLNPCTHATISKRTKFNIMLPTHANTFPDTEHG